MWGSKVQVCASVTSRTICSLLRDLRAQGFTYFFAQILYLPTLPLVLLSKRPDFLCQITEIAQFNEPNS